MIRAHHAPLVLGLILAALYPLTWSWPPSLSLALFKGAAVALFAVTAARTACGFDGWLFVTVMAFGALGDVLIEWRQDAGAGAFIGGHVAAMTLYFRNWRPGLTFVRRLAASLFVGACCALAMLLVPPAMTTGVAIYAFFVSGMTASAWTSRFPRDRVALGALLFLASDMLIFARMGPLAAAGWITLAIWVLYVAGQALICIGVKATLARPVSR